MRTLSASFVAVLGLAAVANADVIGQFNFNSISPDANTSTGSLLPNIGTGSLALLGVTSTFASGDASGGSSDPATGDDSGLNTTGYAAQGAASGERGVRFNISTAGFSVVEQFVFDLRFSNTSNRFVRVDYSLDGATFVTGLATFENTSGGDVWNNLRTVDLTGIVGAGNNPNFAVRVVSVFGPGGAYVASSPTGTYSANGTLRFDQVTVIGQIPTPGAAALLGLGVLAVGRRRR
jgi:uncharacterized protein (TIGR03382 family)